MKETTKKIVYGFGIFFIALFAFGVVEGVYHAEQNNNTGITADATYNTNRNVFISSCDSGKNAGTQTQCSCTWYALDNYYKQQSNPQWYTDSTLINRITSQGYTQAETDAYSGCFQ